jgi:hypothetical protein
MPLAIPTDKPVPAVIQRVELFIGAFYPAPGEQAKAIVVLLTNSVVVGPLLATIVAIKGVVLPMSIYDRPPTPDISRREEMAFQLAVLQDASRQADEYWGNWLWRREQPVFGPSGSLIDALCDRYEMATIKTAWSKWFEVLTSWEFADALIGRDVRGMMGERELAAPGR